MGPRILVVEDEDAIQELIRFNLERAGYEVTIASDGPSGLNAILTGDFQLVILDLMLPEMDGYEICRLTRQESNIPIIILTARSQEAERLLGLELGADDYLTKPFSILELMARVKAVLRRTEPVTRSERIKIGGVQIDLQSYQVFVHHKPVELTPKEFSLLRIMFEHRGQVLSRELLLDKVWGYDYQGETRTVDVHIRHLRQKLGEGLGDQAPIETVHGIGYRLKGERYA